MRLRLLLSALAAVLMVVACIDAPSPTQPQLEAGLISGTCFRDLNGNGVRDGGESGVGGLTVVVMTCPPTTACSGIIVAQTVTASDGSFVVTGVPNGEYNVAAWLPDGYVQTTTFVHLILDSTHAWQTGLLFGSRSSS
jgi:hypothetical protein